MSTDVNKPAELSTTRLLTAAELAPALRLTPRTVLQMARRGDIPCHRYGRQVRFDLAAVMDGAFVREGRPATQAALDVAKLGLVGRTPRRKATREEDEAAWERDNDNDMRRDLEADRQHRRARP